MQPHSPLRVAAVHWSFRLHSDFGGVHSILFHIDGAAITNRKQEVLRIDCLDELALIRYKGTRICGKPLEDDLGIPLYDSERRIYSVDRKHLTSALSMCWPNVPAFELEVFFTQDHVCTIEEDGWRIRLAPFRLPGNAVACEIDLGTLLQRHGTLRNTVLRRHIAYSGAEKVLQLSCPVPHNSRLELLPSSKEGEGPFSPPALPWSALKVGFRWQLNSTNGPVLEIGRPNGAPLLASAIQVLWKLLLMKLGLG